VVALAVNTKLVKSGVEEIPEVFSLYDLLVVNAGAEFMLKGSIDKGRSVYEMVKDLIVEKEDGIYLSNKALKLIDQNAKTWNRVKMRAIWAAGPLKPLAEDVAEAGERLIGKVTDLSEVATSTLGGRVASAAGGGVGVATYYWWDLLAKSASEVAVSASASLASMPLPVVPIVATAVLSGLATVAGAYVWWGKDGKSAGIVKPQTELAESEEIVLTESDMQSLRTRGSESIERMRKMAARAAREEEMADKSEDKFISGRQWQDAGAFSALADWSSRAIEIAFGFKVDPDNNIGFYLEKGKSRAHQGQGSIAFNLDPGVGENYGESMVRALEGDASRLLSDTAVTVIHEGVHLEDEKVHGRVTGGSNTVAHDRVFNTRIYKQFSKFVQEMMKTEDGEKRIHKELRNLATEHPATNVAGPEFYARL
jgi:hypothetical protein